MNNQTQSQPHAAGEAADPTHWIIAEWLTGPTTPRIGGVTVEEACEYTDYWSQPEPRDNSRYPKARHTAISVGESCVAIAVGENHQAQAAFIVRACNNHAALVVALKNLADEWEYQAEVGNVSLKRVEYIQSRTLLANMEAAQ